MRRRTRFVPLLALGLLLTAWTAVTVPAGALPVPAGIAGDPGDWYRPTFPDGVGFFVAPPDADAPWAGELFVTVMPGRPWPETGPPLDVLFSGFFALDVFDPTDGSTITAVTLDQHDGERHLAGGTGDAFDPFTPPIFIDEAGDFTIGLGVMPPASGTMWQYSTDGGHLLTPDSDFVPHDPFAGAIDPDSLIIRDPRAGAVSTGMIDDVGILDFELIPPGERILPTDELPGSEPIDEGPGSPDDTLPDIEAPDDTALPGDETAGATTDTGDTAGDTGQSTAATGGSAGGSGAAGGGGGGGGGALWLIIVVGIIIVVLGGYLYATGRIGGRGVPTELGRHVTALPADEKRRVVDEFKKLDPADRQAYVDYVKELNAFHQGQRSSPPEPPQRSGTSA
ncbi:MAG: hypothetical protein D6683_04505 [Actinomyces sp.]|nr:MAG: hypothetical protein D6683_04505 [Actinomyces sp.]